MGFLGLLLVLVHLTLVKCSEPSNPAFDYRIYEEVLDPEACQNQLYQISRNLLLRMRFLDSGIRFPRGISRGNTVDMGHYHQCLGIDEELNVEDGDVHIEGKFCKFNTHDLEIKIPDDNPDQYSSYLSDFEAINDNYMVTRAMSSLKDFRHIVDRTNINGNIAFQLAICIPKPCSIQEGLNGLYTNLTELGVHNFGNDCRFLDDKPWTPADTVTLSVFCFICALTLMSTLYDLYQKFHLKTDPKNVNKYWTSFSVYTNTRRLTTFTASPGSLECVDGIRAISMLWVIAGHSFSTLPRTLMNPLAYLEFLRELSSIWVIAAPIAVDTFFLLSGLLLVYTAAAKFTSMKLLKTLHLFYLHRYLRMFPLLAAAILLQISVYHHIADGPNWNTVAIKTNDCRSNWWVTLLYVQNYVRHENTCVPHSWYLAVDMQLYILSPIVLFFVLTGCKKIAWSGLVTALLGILTASTIFVFIMNFEGHLQGNAIHNKDGILYNPYYYKNTLTRGSPFVVGMLFGYILHVWRDKNQDMKISRVVTIVLWIIALGLIAGAFFIIRPIFASADYDNRLLDNFINAFQRPAWASGIGLLIFLCHHGYGGPIDWLLSLQIWKLTSRISYGMYLFHYPIMYVVSGTAIMPTYFTEAYAMFLFLPYLVLTFIVTFILTTVIDSPFSTLIKLLLTPGSPNRKTDEVATNQQYSIPRLKGGLNYSGNTP